MRSTWIRRSLALAALLIGGSWLGAHVRLEYAVNGVKLAWPNPTNLSVVINSTGSEDIPGNSEEIAVRTGLSVWNAVEGSSVRFAENQDPGQQARTDWEDEGLRLVMFDETNTSGFFPQGSGIVAITPVLFFTDGRIIDADVLYNGRQFQFTTSGAPGRFDVADVGTHELGHFVGLDHSGWAGGTMFPFVDPTVLLHRSLSLDEVRGMQHVYPAGSFGRITGIVERASNQTPVSGAHVVAVSSDGRTASARITNGTGGFTLEGLTTDTYSVYATPWEGPVSAGNLGTGTAIQTDFESTQFGMIAVTQGQLSNLGTVAVDANVSVSLGRSTDVLPLRAVSGATTPLTLRGTSLAAGSVLTASDPDVTVNVTSWGGSMVQFDVTVPGGELPGHVDLVVTSAGGESSILPAALELTPPDPVITQVSPATFESAGGVTLTITGTDFQTGARIVVGDRIYAEGAGATLTPTTITVMTDATVVGLHDVVVIGPTGVEGRMSGGVAVTGPVEVFPAGGDSLGGTAVTVSGANFALGTTTVSIDSVPQTVDSIDGTELRFTTTAGVVGAPRVLEVFDSGVPVSTGAFTYANKPDPMIASISPDGDVQSGGTTVTVSGANFTSETRVVFGADSSTGAGGAQAGSTVLVDASTLQVVVPPFSAGTTSVMVREEDSAQADLLPSAFTYEAQAASSSGGGCSAGIGTAPPTWRSVLSNLLWIVALFAILAVRARRVPAQVPVR